ncbi:hypothetical protein KIN20_023369 [Parelaphostrongylus tenuis]|uniref:Uncharacterized protein n=1 Tax=Parelaphostrongylus tenuis TaxID=148309 RepID=A0AAD5N732_PARTN|nr:hypothetical protein KIN20_023369 [Parelaphostrongylus tenuis]
MAVFFLPTDSGDYWRDNGPQCNVHLLPQRSSRRPAIQRMEGLICPREINSTKVCEID